MSVYVEYPVGRCAGEMCAYAEPHRHGFECDKACACRGIGAVTAPLGEDDLQECDWGRCNRPAVALRLEVDITGTTEECWLSVCSWHAGWDDHESRDCQHDLSLTGDEGPIDELGRWPRRWKCDECGAIIHDPESGGSGS